MGVAHPLPAGHLPPWWAGALRAGTVDGRLGRAAQGMRARRRASGNPPPLAPLPPRPFARRDATPPNTRRACKQRATAAARAVQVRGNGCGVHLPPASAKTGGAPRRPRAMAMATSDSLEWMREGAPVVARRLVQRQERIQTSAHGWKRFKQWQGGDGVGRVASSSVHDARVPPPRSSSPAAHVSGEGRAA